MDGPGSRRSANGGRRRAGGSVTTDPPEGSCGRRSGSGNRHAIRRARRRRAQRGRTASGLRSTTIRGDRSRRHRLRRIDRSSSLRAKTTTPPRPVCGRRGGRGHGCAGCARSAGRRGSMRPARGDASADEIVVAADFGPVRAVVAAVAFEQFDGVVDDVLDVRGVPHREGRSTPRATPPRSRGCERRRACRRHRRRSVGRRLADRGQQPGAHDDIDEKLGDLGAAGEFSLVEVGVDSVLLGEIDEQAGAVAGRQFTDLGEAEPLLGERADLLDSFEVGVVVERPTALARWGEQPCW